MGRFFAPWHLPSEAQIHPFVIRHFSLWRLISVFGGPFWPGRLPQPSGRLAFGSIAQELACDGARSCVVSRSARNRGAAFSCAASRPFERECVISAHVIRQVETLLARGALSQRGIARQVGISRGTVGRVAAGKITSTGRQARENRRHGSAEIISTFRCPNCGGLSTRFPCARCYVETVKARLKPLTLPENCVNVGLELRPEDHQRYQEVRRWRREAARKHA